MIISARLGNQQKYKSEWKTIWWYYIYFIENLILHERINDEAINKLLAIKKWT